MDQGGSLLPPFTDFVKRFLEPSLIWVKYKCLQRPEGTKDLSFNGVLLQRYNQFHPGIQGDFQILEIFNVTKYSKEKFTRTSQVKAFIGQKHRISTPGILFNFVTFLKHFDVDLVKMITVLSFVTFSIKELQSTNRSELISFQKFLSKTKEHRKCFFHQKNSISIREAFLHYQTYPLCPAR